MHFFVIKLRQYAKESTHLQGNSVNSSSIKQEVMLSNNDIDAVFDASCKPNESDLVS